MKRSYYFALAVGLLLLALVMLVYQGLRNDRGGSGQREVKQDPVSQNPTNPSGSAVVRKSEGRPMAKDSDALEKIRALVSVKDMGGLLRVVGTFEANEFPEVWVLLSSLPDQPFVNELKQRALLRASFLEDPGVLLRVVVDSTGVGNVRNGFIKDAFSGPKVGISRLKELADALKDPAERLAAWQGIGWGLSLRESLAEFDFTVLRARESPEEESALIAGLGGYPIARMVGLDEALLRSRVVEALSVAKRLADEGSVDEGVPGDVVYEMSRNISPKVWPIIEEEFPEIAADPQIVARTMDRAARTYPMAVLDISIGNKAVAPEVVAKAVLNGLRDDSAKVEAWFSDKRHEMSPVNELAVIGGIAEHYARSGDQEKAAEWIGSINDSAQEADFSPLNC